MGKRLLKQYIEFLFYFMYSGDHMVCIIDDREDVWNYAPNLVHVKPYVFFKNAGDINAPEKFQAASQNKSKTDYLRPPRRFCFFFSIIL